MKNVGIVVDNIKSKAEELIKRLRDLETDNGQLNAEREKLLKERQEQRDKIASLEERVKVLETSRSIVDAMGSPKTAKQKVNRILREIDSCIALMNKIEGAKEPIEYNNDNAEAAEGTEGTEKAEGERKSGERQENKATGVRTVTREAKATEVRERETREVRDYAQRESRSAETNRNVDATPQKDHRNRWIEEEENGNNNDSREGAGERDEERQNWSEEKEDESGELVDWWGKE